jgi:hypothetical protein
MGKRATGRRFAHLRSMSFSQATDGPAFFVEAIGLPRIDRLGGLRGRDEQALGQGAIREPTSIL